MYSLVDTVFLVELVMLPVALCSLGLPDGGRITPFGATYFVVPKATDVFVGWLFCVGRLFCLFSSSSARFLAA